MNRLFLLLFCFCVLMGCDQEDDALSSSAPGTLQLQCDIDTSLVTNKDWLHVAGILATLRFEYGGNYFENNEIDGVWQFSNGCDSIFVSRPSNSFYYRVESVSNDTLVLVNPVFGFVTFYSE